MRSKITSFWIILAVASVLLPGCGKKDSESAEVMVKEYWQNVFTGNVEKAYSMLSRESRREMAMEEYARRVAFDLRESPVKDSFWEVYAPICDVSMGPTIISGDTAWVDVLLTLPDLPWLVQKLAPRADSLFTEADSLARNEWLLRELTSSIRKKYYRPLVMHLALRLQWEWGAWHLVYDWKPEEK